MARRVWLDVDPAVGVPTRDIDDGLAMLQALRSPELEVAGISTVFGNTTLDGAHALAQELLRLSGDAVALHRGAASAHELGAATAASDALADALERKPLTVLALGPATNVATVLDERPDLHERVEELVCVAGRRPGQQLTAGDNPAPIPDFNFECDVPAFASILAAQRVPLLLTGFEAASHVVLGHAELERLHAGPRAARWLAGAAESWIAWWKERFGVCGFHPFDTLAVAAAATPTAIEREAVRVAIVAAAEPARRTYRGQAPAGAQLQAAPDLPGRPNAAYATRPGDGFVEDLLSRLLRRR